MLCFTFACSLTQLRSTFASSASASGQDLLTLERVSARIPFVERCEASNGLLFWQAKRNHLPISFGVPCLPPEADRYKEFNDHRHRSPHTGKNKVEATKFSLLTNLYIGLKAT